MISLILPTLGKRENEIHRLFSSLEKQSYKDFELIIVSQDNHNKIKNLTQDYELNYQHVKVHEKSLSNARNIGLKYVRGDIVGFTDDDCWYPIDSLMFIHDYFKNYNREIGCFQIYDPTVNESYKKYNVMSKEILNLVQLFRISSIEIFVNLKKVSIKDLMFDVNFGLGSKYPSGEESILLIDLYKKGYKISYSPNIVVFHRKKENALSNKILISKGPMFKRMFNSPIAIILLFLLMFKKNKLHNFGMVYLATKELFNYNR